MAAETGKPFAVAPGEGLAFENPVGGVLTFKALADQTGGALTALETTAAPGEGPLLHVHDQDELIYIQEGRFRVKLDERLIDAPAGAFFFIPRGTPHTWQNVGDEPARFLAAVLPGAPGFEEFFARYRRLPPEERGPKAFARLAAETDAMRVVGPTLAESDPL